MLNVSDIAQDADINQKQAKDWLQILENYVVSEIAKSYWNSGREQYIQVRHRRTCREARAAKELSSARLCDPPETGLSAGDTPAESCIFITKTRRRNRVKYQKNN